VHMHASMCEETTFARRQARCEETTFARRQCAHARKRLLDNFIHKVTHTYTRRHAQAAERDMRAEAGTQT
jgi:hypothetical protein